MKGLPQDKLLTLLNIPPTHIQQRVRDKVVLTCSEIEVLYFQPITVPVIEYGLTGRVAAYAHGARRIEINTELLIANEEHFIAQVIPHEVCHIACSQLYPTDGRTGHGPKWQIMMLKLGLRPDRCHQYETKPARHHPRKYVYTCGCQEYKLTSHRHNKIQRGIGYRCHTCGGLLTYARTLED